MRIDSKYRGRRFFKAKSLHQKLGGIYNGNKDLTAQDGGHQPMNIHYNCPECNEFWINEWCSAVDAECPNCSTKNVSPFIRDLIEDQKGQ